MTTPVEDEILRSLRRITRAIDIHSRKLATTFGLTAPQLVCLRTLAQSDVSTPSALARAVSLSQATVTGIIDRLVARQLVTRKRSRKDRRVVTIQLTEAGRALIKEAPSPLQAHFVEALEKLSDEEQRGIQASLDRVVRMMGIEDIEAAPLLSSEAVLPPLDAGALAEAASAPEVAVSVCGEEE